MTTRRTILQSAAVLSAAPLAPRAVFGDGPSAGRIDAVVDSRHEPARAFGRRATRLGAVSRPIEGDITALWRGDLEPRLKVAPAFVVGLTERPALFLLEQLGRGYGMRVVFQAEHATAASGRVAHRIVRSDSPSLATGLDEAGRLWPQLLAERLLITSGEVAAAEAGPSGAAMAARMDEPVTLHSWMIAPPRLLHSTW